MIRVEINGVAVNHLDATDPPGSVSSEDGDDRHVYVFGFVGGIPGVWEAIGGIELATPRVRGLMQTQLTALSDLAEPYDLHVKRHGQSFTMRLTRDYDD